MSEKIIQTYENSADDYVFFENIIIPLFTGTIHKKIFTAVYALDGKIIIASDQFAGYFGFTSSQQVQGKTLREISEIAKLDKFITLTERLNEIRLKVISSGTVITHLNLVPFQNKTLTSIVYNLPIYSTDGSKVLATRAIARKIDLANSVSAMNNSLINEPPIAKINPLSLQLSPRQNEIIYLLTIGFSQSQAADYLDITRGTISKIISENICPLFNIAGSNTKLLVKTIIASKYFETFSNPFLEPRIIEIDSNIELTI